MNPDFRKVALIAATLGLLVSLFVALREDGDKGATTTKGPGTIRLDYVITGGTPEGGVARDSVARGRIVVIRVTSDVADEVHVHGYDLSADVAPGVPATISFTADAAGRFEIELEDGGLQVAELAVRP